MLRKEYIEELDRLKRDVLNMGLLAKEAAGKSIEALINKDLELANKIIEDNSIIDDLEFDIENRCMKLIALQQPMAADLRVIGTCLKIITDFDRISDVGGDIAEIVLRIGDEPFVKPLIDTPRMSELTQKMIEDCLKAFKSENIVELEDFSGRDDVVDGLYDQIRRELITIMIEKPNSIANASHLMFVAMYLERIGDHACNIASRIVYMVTGEKKKMG
ncbi:MAG: phosphate signaling complex protein PhoU [Halobacteriota archaeon]|nr:phosphate signaling complex protein PhoU [Halobacteriota archaeon]